MISVRKKPNLHLEFYKRDVTGGMRTPWKLPVDVMSKSFQEAIKVQGQMQMIQKMIHRKVQNMGDAPVPAKQQRSRQVQCCRSPADDRRG